MLVFFALGNALGNAKVLSFALADAKLLALGTFASQWNIGLTHIAHVWHCAKFTEIFKV